jgi:integrase
MVFLFEELLKMDLSDASWHPKHQPRTDEADGDVREDAPASTDEGATDADEEGEQSTLLTRLLFHTSLPINDALDLCAGDVDLDAGLIYVSDQMGTPKRIIELPDTLYDPLRQHLQRLREKHGRRYFDAPLFQAKALKGRADVNDDANDESSTDSEEESEPVTADGSPEASSDKPASLWGYADDE